jgi:hypothetical protein
MVVLVTVFGVTLAVAVVHPKLINEAHKEPQEKDTVLVVTVAMLQLAKKQETLDLCFLDITDLKGELWKQNLTT